MKFFCKKKLFNFRTCYFAKPLGLGATGIGHQGNFIANVIMQSKQPGKIIDSAAASLITDFFIALVLRLVERNLIINVHDLVLDFYFPRFEVICAFTGNWISV